MDNFTGSAMIALLPTSTDWCQIDLPHLTLVFVGDIKDLKPNVYNEVSKDVASLAMISNPITLQVMGVEIFGDIDKVNAMRLRPNSQLIAMRRFVEKWNASDFPFNPHVTIGPVGSVVENIPRFLSFDRISVGWGDQCLTFWLKTGSLVSP